MELVTIVQIAFAASAAVAALTLLGVTFDRVRPRLLRVLAVLTGLAQHIVNRDLLRALALNGRLVVPSDKRGLVQNRVLIALVPIDT